MITLILGANSTGLRPMMVGDLVVLTDDPLTISNIGANPAGSNIVHGAVGRHRSRN
jgi:hypothetical protein